MGRVLNFGKNVLVGNDTKMQGLMAKLEKLTKSEGRLVGAETLVETKNTGKGVQAIQGSMTEQKAAMNQQTTAMAALQVSAHEVRTTYIIGRETHTECVSNLRASCKCRARWKR